VQAGLAELWSASDDGTILTFKINPKAIFHNGDAVTANDVKVSLTRNVSQESVVYKYYDVINGAKDYHAGKAVAVDGLKVVDSNTIEIHLEKAFPPLLYVLAGATAKILPAKLVAKKDFFKKPIGTGPFAVQRISENKIYLTRFAVYHSKLPQISGMELVMMDQKDAMEEATLGKIHDLSSWPMNGQEAVFKSGKDISSIVADTWVIGLNARLKPFDNLEVRKLFQQSFDTQKFRDTFYPDAKVAFGYVPPSFPGHRTTKLETVSKIEKPPRELITINIPAELDKSSEMAQFITDQFNAKGWNVKVVMTKWDKMMAEYSAKTLQSFLVAMIVDYPDPEFLLNNFESTNPDNFSGLNDPGVDSLIVQSRSTQDRIKRQSIQLELAERIDGLALSINLFHSRAHYWVSKCVEGFRPNLLAVAYTDYRNVYFDMDCLRRGAK